MLLIPTKTAGEIAMRFTWFYQEIVGVLGGYPPGFEVLLDFNTAKRQQIERILTAESMISVSHVCLLINRPEVGGKKLTRS